MILPVENKKHYVVNLSNILFIIHCLKLEPGKEEGVDSNLWVNKRHWKFSGCLSVFVDSATEGRAAALMLRPSQGQAALVPGVTL